MRRPSIALAIGALVVITACGSEGEEPEAGQTSVPTAVETSPEPARKYAWRSTHEPTPSQEPTPTAQDITDQFYEGFPTPGEPGKFAPKGGGPLPEIELARVGTGRGEGYDIIIFVFRGGMPQVEFWHEIDVIDPATGQEVVMPGKPNANLFVRMKPALDQPDNGLGDSVPEGIAPFKTSLDTILSFVLYDNDGIEAHIGVRVMPNSDDARQVTATRTYDAEEDEHELILWVWDPPIYY